MRSGRLVLALVMKIGMPKRLPSRINCAVPPGTGEAGETEAVTATAAPCTTDEGVTAIVMILGMAA